MLSSFLRCALQIFIFLGFLRGLGWVEYYGRFETTCRSPLQGSLSPSLLLGPLKTGPIICPETSPLAYKCLVQYPSWNLWAFILSKLMFIHFREWRVINRLKPNDPYKDRTAPLTSKLCILYIYSTNIGTEYFKHNLYSPFFLFKMLFVS
jgi:hypothetical protein